MALPGSIDEQFLLLEYALCDKLMVIDYGTTVKHIYNPLEYAKVLHEQYVSKFCNGPKKVLLIGMNPGPKGMGQTGIPFGDVPTVKNWMKITGDVQKPANEHPNARILGLKSEEKEVSGKRMYGLLKELSGTPEVLFRHVFLHNYCPFAFLKDDGTNITPKDFPVPAKKELESACDDSFIDTIKLLDVEYVVAIGDYVSTAIKRAIKRANIQEPNRFDNVKISLMRHPSSLFGMKEEDWKILARQQLIDAKVISFFRTPIII